MLLEWSQDESCDLQQSMLALLSHNEQSSELSVGQFALTSVIILLALLRLASRVDDPCLQVYYRQLLATSSKQAMAAFMLTHMI